MKILVTGGLGFQGLHLCKLLVGNGHDVTILTTPSERSINAGKCVDARIVWGSITDPDVVCKAVRDRDFVHHLAANIHVDESADDPGAYFRTNVLGTMNVAKACIDYGVPLLHVSTCEVYGGCDKCSKPTCIQGLISESCSMKPQSPYAASKAGADCLVQSYVTTYGLNAVIVRPSNVFGPGQRGGKRGAVIPRFIKHAQDNEPLLVYGGGTQRRDYIYVGDLVRVYVALQERMLSSGLCGVYNVGSGADVSVRDLAMEIVKLLGSESTIEFGDPRPGEVTAFKLDSSLLRNLGIRWEPNFDTSFANYIRTNLVCS